MAKDEVRMECQVQRHQYVLSEEFPTLVLPKEYFLSDAPTVEAHDACWNENFHRRHRHEKIRAITDFLILVHQGPRVESRPEFHPLNQLLPRDYLGFASATFLSPDETQPRSDSYRSIEEVMLFRDRARQFKKPGEKGSRVAFALLSRLMLTLQKKSIEVAYLECDRAIKGGYLVQLYEQFGFEIVT
jgi:hypothetical protein